MQGRTINESLAIRMAGTPGTWAAAAVYGNWVQLAGKARRALLICGNGELDGSLKVEVFEATDASGTGAQELSAITTGETFVNGTDEGHVGLIEIRDSELSSGYTHIACLVTPGATDSFAAFWVLGDLYTSPAANAVADNVTFNVGE